MTTTSTGNRLVAINQSTLSRIGQAEIGSGFDVNGLTVSGHTLFVSTTGDKIIRQYTIATVPDAPTNPVVTESNRSLSFDWVAPASVENITGYTVTAISATGQPIICQTTATSCVLSELQNGAVYGVQITATSIAGTSTPTTLSGSPFTLPSSPANPRGTRGDAEIAVEWEAGDLGGRSLLKYTAVAHPGNHVCETALNSCTITGLVNGTEYEVSVMASTVAGESVAATLSGKIIPATNPEPVTAVQVSTGNQQLTIDWQAPTDTGGLPLQEFEVRDFETNELVCLTETNSCLIASLVNGVQRKFVVYSKNEVGYGPGVETEWSTPFDPTPPIPTPVTPGTDPTVPPTVEPGTGSGSGTGTSAADNQTKPVTNPPVITDPTIETTPTVTKPTVPAQPQSLTIQAQPKQKYKLSWLLASDGGKPIKQYLIESRTNLTKPFKQFTKVSGTKPEATFKLKKQKTIYFRVIAVNAKGKSLPSPVLSVYLV